jgi:hypothetical protein
MTTDPHRIVEDLEAEILDEEGAAELAGDVPAPVAEDVSPQTPGTEPSD